MTNKKITHTFLAREALEGAGVKLHRGFANAEIPQFDPFLLFDDFSATNPADYLAGFPMHPHRGIETVTYILQGDVRHRDSIGNSGLIGAGDIQWMTSGSGIIHEEMPEGTRGIQGFQLWVNLPQKDKMMRPRYQEIKNNQIPEISFGNHARIKIIAGDADQNTGPVRDIMVSPLYLDIYVEPGKKIVFPVIATNTTFAYIFEGKVGLEEFGRAEYDRGTIILFDKVGDTVELTAGGAGARFLLISGKPLGEQIAWYGPIVMNSEQEIKTAMEELRSGEFIK
jgi:redox-sensitive bicupin YhaK (pirin superfamily)